MNVDYIIVQAGGKGTRMEHLTVNKPKALVPVNNEPLLFHLFRKYPEKRFIIITDYKKDVMRKYLEAFASVKYLLVDASGRSGTCAGLSMALNVVPSNCSFMLIWSDLLLADNFNIPQNVANYVGLSKSFRCRWSFRSGVFEEIPSEEYGVAGFFIFKEKSILNSVPEEGEFVRWLSSADISFETVGLYSAREYGLVSEWMKTCVEGNVTGTRCRPFNSVIVDDDRVVKEGIDNQGRLLITREISWYKCVRHLGFNSIPEIYSYDPLTMERIRGKNIFQYALSMEQKKSVLCEIVRILKSLHNLETRAVDYFSVYEAYVGKTLKRLNKVRNMIPFADKQFITVNGKRCRNIFFFQDEFKKRLDEYRCDEFRLIHGDSTFSNIMLDCDMQPVMIDPRGYFGYTDLFGDATYDWAKLYYSIVGNYDQFNMRKFRLSIDYNEIKLDINSNGWECLEPYYLNLIEGEVKTFDLKLIHSIIWLSLTTYAWEDYDSICGAFYNGLYYLEDVL